MGEGGGGGEGHEGDKPIFRVVRGVGDRPPVHPTRGNPVSYWAITISVISSTLTKSDYFFWLYRVKHFTWREKNNQNGNLVKFIWLECLRQMLMVKSCLCSLLKNIWDHVFQESDIYLVGAEHKKRAGWEQSYLKSGCLGWIGKFVIRAESFYDHWLLPSSLIIRIWKLWILVSLTKNTTSITQTVDQSAIRILKGKYRPILVHRIVIALVNKKPIPKIQQPWSRVSTCKWACK